MLFFWIKQVTQYKKKMKLKITIIILVIFTCNTVWSQTKVDSSKIVRVLSFNIFHGATTKGDFDLDVIAKVINDVNPDLVALQEVDFKTKRSRRYDLSTELGWRTKMSPLFGKAMSFDDGEYGVGILSKFGFLQTRNVALPFSPENEPRTALEVLTQLPSKDTIVFIGTHFDSLKDDKDRIDQAKKINELVSLNKYPTILAGDLNDIPESTPINILEKVWSSSYNMENPKFTFPSGNPLKKIDYIMFYPKNRWKVLETKVINDSIASDHCAYLIILELLDE